MWVRVCPDAHNQCIVRYLNLNERKAIPKKHVHKAKHSD